VYTGNQVKKYGQSKKTTTVPFVVNDVWSMMLLYKVQVGQVKNKTNTSPWFGDQGVSNIPTIFFLIKNS
jgi:hypothetical protein